MKHKSVDEIIAIGLVFLFVISMLVIPLISVLANGFSKGFAFFIASISNDYVISAIKLTLHW